ncbi:oxoglutarate dehydrogenase (succinyl-transferring) [Flavobacteriaceae bacterium UJ101]|nr:oxoglutarate dehydrogenase (succinyl-transferring) [Flavobacteriaceae bacterium UJ101]
MDRYSFLNAVHPEVLETQYEKYLQSPDSVEPSWRAFFQGFDFGRDESYGEELFEAQTAVASNSNVSTSQPVSTNTQVNKEFKVINLINDYRKRGHLFTKTNPVRERRDYNPKITLQNHGLSEADLNDTFKAGEIIGLPNATLKEIIAQLKSIYCESIGVEYMYIRDPEKVEWIQSWINRNSNKPNFSVDQKKHILHKLNQAVSFENYLHTKFVGQKRFSLEGGETLIPALDSLIEHATNQHHVEEFVVGMAHRGRLNVLTNIFGKTYEQIFSEFQGKELEESVFSGDVKYHLGSTTFAKSSHSDKQVKINLAPNPSHLETVDAVVEGIARAKVDLDYDGDYNKLVPVLIHGDAAVAGQGIVYEVIQMMKLRGYKTGGTIHIVINNQIGFTTNYLDARSSTYCTDVGKVTLSPVLHVNADDAEAVVHALQFAIDYRMRFGRDVFIDLLGYRKYGHNEGDEPRFTQPKLYKAISKHPNPRQIYNDKLKQEGIIGDDVLKEMEKQFKELLDKDFDASKAREKNQLEPFMEDEWEGYELMLEEKGMFEPVDTTVSKETLTEIAKVLGELPSDKKFIRKIEKIINGRKKAFEEGTNLDWGLAEMLAYGTLMKEGHNVRISGEDVQRGTFSHRHAVVKTEEAEEITLINQLNTGAKFEAYNSHLSEYGVVGFDYGYALAAPNTMTIWEAQFGDFSNGAQIMFDQYMSAAEDKWKMQNGLVLLLPHGYEGQGAEHSSARIERYLQLCASSNMTVANCTTPGNHFHLLRRQMKRNFRKPLVVFTPKSLLRHPRCVSTIDDLANGSFQEVIDDQTAKAAKVKKVVLVSGKFYYDLLAKKEEKKAEHIALVRVEQLYPLAKTEINKIISKYTNAIEIIWAQEEPENMGAWSYILRQLREIPFQVACPPESAATAAGSATRHAKFHNAVIDKIID